MSDRWLVATRWQGLGRRASLGAMTDLPSLPAWAKTLQRRIRQRGIDFFILTGPGVRDLHSLGARRFGTIGDCLAQVIVNDRSAIITYDRGAGIGFADRDVENRSEDDT